MHFTKMHGLGNDYLYVYGEPKNPSELSAKLSERHFGAGSDGMIWISPSDVADFKMRIFNADGSEAKMCGNGIRCVGKYVYDKGYTDKKYLKIETLSGIRTLELQVVNGKVKNVTVNMGKAIAEDKLTLMVDGEKIICTPVSVGNPHAVIFVEDIETAPVTTLGQKLEHHKAFPDGVNVEFVQVLGKSDTVSPSTVRFIAFSASACPISTVMVFTLPPTICSVRYLTPDNVSMLINFLSV